MRLLICLLATFALTLSSVQAQYGPLTPISPVLGASGDRVGTSVSVSGARAAIGAPFSDGTFQNSGAVYLYNVSFGTWPSDGRITASDPSADSFFGQAISLSVSTVAVGAPGEDRGGQADLGSVYIFRRNGSGWVQLAKITAPDPVVGHRFGAAVSLVGAQLFIGAPGDGARVGAVYRYEEVGGVWTYRGKWTPPTGYAQQNFGHSVASDGVTTVVGMLENNPEGSQAGVVHVYRQSLGVWGLEAVFGASDSHLDDRFGVSVSVSGSSIAVGAMGSVTGGVNNGAAYVFRRVNGVWGQFTKVLPPVSQANQFAGHSVTIAGSDLLVGAPFADTPQVDAGKVFVFRSGVSGYSHLQTYTGINPEAGDRFGSAVAFAPKRTILIGAPLDDDRGANSGLAYQTPAWLLATTARAIICDPSSC